MNSNFNVLSSKTMNDLKGGPSQILAIQNIIVATGVAYTDVSTGTDNNGHGFVSKTISVGGGSIFVEIIKENGDAIVISLNP